jgi:hypothetical protein
MQRPSLRSDLVLAACLLLLASCEAKCTTGDEAAQVAKQIAPAVSARAGVPVEITCPELREDQVNSCQARTQTGETFTVAVQARKGGPDKWHWETKNVDFGKSVAENIQKLYAEAHGIELPGLTCPPLIIAGAKEPSRCQTRTQNVDVLFELTLDEGDATFHPRRGFVVSEAAAKLAVDELAKLGVQAEVDCGPALRLSVPGSTFTCMAKDTTGATRPLYYRVTSDDGAIELRDRPFE